MKRVDAKLWQAVAVLMGTVVLAAVAAGSVSVAEEGGGVDGKEVFLAQRCNMCHSVPGAEIAAKTKSATMKGPDLPTAEGREADWIVKFVRKEVELDGKTHKKASKASDEELAALTAWLTTQPAGSAE